MTCDRFYLPNSDPHMCRKGDVMYVKPDDHNPRPYCEKDFPVYNYPGMSRYLLDVITFSIIRDVPR